MTEPRRYEIVLRKEQWEVRFQGRRDPELTIAVRQAVTMSNGKPTALETQRKAARFLCRFFNFRFRRADNRDAFIAESIRVGRMRLEALLHQLGFLVVYDTNRFDGGCHVRGVERSISELPVWLAALSRTYAALARAGLRSSANPLKIDRWHEMSAVERFEIADLMLGSKARHGSYRGSQYVAKGSSPSPLRIEDARELGPKVLAAGRAAGWPAAIVDLVSVIGVEGSRWSSTSPLTAADWGRSSGFGRTLWAPSKRSNGRRVFHIVVTTDIVLQLRASFDADPTRPGMAELERLLADKNWVALERIYLFPSSRGVPHSYHVYNNDHFRPAMEAAGVVITGKNGSVRPTGHRLRSARIQESVDAIITTERSIEDIEHALDRLQSDVFIKSKKAFYRYVGDRMDELGIAEKIARFDARAKIAAAARQEGRPPETKRERSKSAAQLRLEQIEREELGA